MALSGLGPLLAQLARTGLDLASPAKAHPPGAHSPGADPPGTNSAQTRDPTLAARAGQARARGVEAFARSSATTIARTEVSTQAQVRVPFTPGQVVTARVVSALPEPGRFVVDVQGRGLDLNLPAQTPVGRTLTLTYVGAEPRPTFVLHAVRQNPPSVQVSNAAHMVGVLADDQPADAAATVRQSGMRAAAPILPEPPRITEQLAQGLSRTLRQSGLFYESHQAQWVQGRLPIEALRREPQGRLEPLSPTDADEPRPAEARVEPARAERLAASVAPETRDLVRQQIGALDSRLAVWHGELWPGTAMDWRVEEHEAQGGRGERDSGWSTQLSVHFPRIGAVRAALTLQGDRVDIRLVAADGATLERMRAEAPQLAAQFQARGLELKRLEFAHDER
jgi:hypothetical protein